MLVSFDLEFPVWIIAAVEHENATAGAFVRFNDPVHESCFPIFTDTDLAERFKENAIKHDQRLLRIIEVKNKTILGNVLKALKKEGCQYVTRDFFFRQNSATGQYITVENAIAWCDHNSDT